MSQAIQRLLLAIVLAGSAHASALVGGQGSELSARHCAAPSIKDEYAAAIDVVEARVVAIKPVDASQGRKRFDAVTLRVYRSYKHRGGGQIVFNNPHGPSAFPVAVGGFYLLFLRARAPNGEITVDPCGASRSMAQDNVPLLHVLNDLSAAGDRGGR